MFSIVIIGEFQKGKSTLVDCILGKNVANRGRGLRTTASVAAYDIGGGMEIVDTPGFNATVEDDKAALAAMDQASAIIFIKDDKGPDERFAKTIVCLRDLAKHCLLLCNFRDPERGWTPDPMSEVVYDLDAEINELGARNLFLSMSPDGAIVTPVNLQWALWCQDLAPESDDDIRFWAEEELGISMDEEGAKDRVRNELWERSGFIQIRRYIDNFPFWILSRMVDEKQKEAECIAMRFAAELKKLQKIV